MPGWPRWTGKVEDLFFSRVFPEPNSGCWLWDGVLTHYGYGGFSAYGVDYKAHRYSYELHKGPIPRGMVIDHKCSNRACVNPDHLDVVTQRVNSQRTAERGRASGGKNGERCRAGHLYDDGNLYIMPNGHRSCRACRRDAARRAYVKKSGYRPTGHQGPELN